MNPSAAELSGSKILVTGATGQVAGPVIASLAGKAEVCALARFADPAKRNAVAELGAEPLSADLSELSSVASLPDDFDYVLNFAVAKSGDFDADFAANAEGIGHLIAHCRRARAVLHCSSTAVYAYEGHALRTESAPLGDNHRAMFPTYSLSKIAAESVARFAARQFGVPTIIARLSVPYGDNGGWPWFHVLMMQDGIPIDVHPERPNTYNPLHADDLADKLPRLLAAAKRDAVTVNLGGSTPVSVEEWCAYLGELTGLEPVFRDNPETFGSLSIDTERMHALIGATHVDWRDGMRRMVAALAPDMLK